MLKVTPDSYLPNFSFVGLFEIIKARIPCKVFTDGDDFGDLVGSLGRQQ
jgi:hypothetical protein